jgi:hypothetical protein
MHDQSIVVATVDDALVRDGQMLVLVASEVMLLSPVSSEIVRVAATGVTISALGTHLEEMFGPPPDGNSPWDQVRLMVARLSEAGVVHVTPVGTDGN